MENILILGAAGRDFHNFNTVFKHNSNYKVVAFTATQIPNISNRRYPQELSGPLYPDGIPIFPEEDLVSLIKGLAVDKCVFSYSDISFNTVMQTASLVTANGASFWLLSPQETMLKSKKPIIAICATRTGCGKSQTTRKLSALINQRGRRSIVIRHPMPYGDIKKQQVQRFASIQDLEDNNCTIEELEEYEPHIARGSVVYAGVDYEKILHQAENDPLGCDVILWDGGNNDTPFLKPDLMITVTDPHRAGDELNYFPGRTNLMLADIIVINKIDSANFNDIEQLRRNIMQTNPHATIVEATSPIHVDHPEIIKDKKVLVIEDGPTITHGNMTIGAGGYAARKYCASEIINPIEYAVGSIAETFKKYPHIQNMLPAMGYSVQQVKELEETIENTPCDSVIISTPVDLSRILTIHKPFTRVHYEIQEIGYPDLEAVIEDFI